MVGAVESTPLVVASDSTAPEEVDAALSPPAEELAPPPAVIQFSGPVIRVDGLVLEGVTEIAEGTGSGYTVVQRLESGGRLTLTVVPRSASGDTLQPGQVRVLDLPDGGATGAAVFGTSHVSASGPITADRLQALLRRLIEAPVVP